MAPIISQISKTTPPARIFTSGMHVAAVFPNGHVRCFAFRLPRSPRYMLRCGGVGWLMMARDVKATSPGSETPGRPPDGGRTASPLSSAPRGAMSFTYTTDLAAIRAVVHRYARQAGLPETRAIDLVLAVSEVAANTIRHAKSPGSLKIWYDATEIVCQIHDEGRIGDPLAGQRRPSLEAMGGHGLWIVHQV